MATWFPRGLTEEQGARFTRGSEAQSGHMRPLHFCAISPVSPVIGGLPTLGWTGSPWNLGAFMLVVKHCVIFTSV